MLNSLVYRLGLPPRWTLGVVQVRKTVGSVITFAAKVTTFLIGKSRLHAELGVFLGSASIGRLDRQIKRCIFELWNASLERRKHGKFEFSRQRKLTKPQRDPKTLHLTGNYELVVVIVK